MSQGSSTQSTKPDKAEPSLRYDHLIQQAVDAIISIDESSRVTVWNTAAEKMFGYSRQEAMGELITNLVIPPAFRERHMEGMKHRQETGEGPLLGRTIRITAMRQGGETFPAELSLFQADLDNNRSHFTAIIRDNSAQKLLESHLEDQLSQVQSRERIAREIAASIRGRHDMEDILNLAVQRLGQFTHADRAVIWLLEAETDNFQDTRYEYRSGAYVNSIRDISAADTPVLRNTLPRGEVVFVADVTQLENVDEESARLIRERHIRSLLQVPLVHQEAFYGILRLHTINDCRVWDDETVGLVKDICESVSAALHEAREESSTREELKQRVRQQEVVSRLSQAALTGVKLEEIFHLAARLIAETLDLPFCKITEQVSENDCKLTFRAVAGFDSKLEGTVFDAKDEPHAAYTLRVDHPVVVEDVWTETRFKPSRLHEEYQLTSGATVVIRSPRTAFGILQVDSRTRRSFHDYEIDFMQAMANVLGIVIERKRAEREAADAEERYHLVLDASKDGLWGWDIAKGEVYWSTRLYEMYGMDPAEFKPDLGSAFALFHPEDRERLTALVQSHLESDAPYEAEYRKMHANGEYRYYYTKGRALRDENGAPTRMVGLVTDITENKKVEETLRHQGEIMRAITDNAMSGLFMVGLDGYCTFINPEAQAMTGYTFEEIRQKSLHELLHHHYPDGTPYPVSDCPIDRALSQNKELRGHEDVFIRKDGTFFPVSCAARPIIRDGVPTATLVEVRDITEEKRAQQAIQESRARLEKIISSNVIGILYWTLDGKITEANDAFLHMLGYSRDELYRGDIRWSELTPPEYRESDDTVTGRLLNGEIVNDYVKQYVHKDGSRIDVLIGLAMLENSANEGICFVQDITARRRAELELEKGLERERLSRRVLEITGQSMDIGTILKSVAEEVGRSFNADRCFLLRYEEMGDGSDQLQLSLSGLYSRSPELANISVEDLPPRLMRFFTKDLSRKNAYRLINTPTPEAYQEELSQRLDELPLSPKERQEYLDFFQVLLFDRYKIQSTLRVGITYRGRGYGAITLHQCDSQRVWTQEEIDLLYNVAHHVGSALYQLELFQQEQTAKQELERNYNLMNIIRQAQSHFITNEDIYSLFEDPLNQLLALTQSEYGFIGEILHTPEGKPYLKCNFLTNIAWNEETLRLYNESKATGFEFHKLDNLFGLVITTGQVVLTNDPDSHPHSAGRPMGHPPLRAFLGMPFYKNNELVGMVGIANKPDGYDMQLVEELQPFLDACANIIVGYRNEKLRAKLTHDLKVSERAMKIYASKLERSNQELEQFATIASHDLQAPLRKVILFSEALKASAGEKLPPESADYVERIQKASRRMQNLITDLLVLSRVTRKGKPFKPVDLGEVLTEALSDLDEYIRESGGRVEVGEMMTIDADAVQIQQMLLNLIGNAVKFHKNGEAPLVKVSAKALNSKTCQLIVEDNGIGFDEKYLDRIFAVFERLHGESEYEGTGMGLAIVQKIAERHGGMVNAKSSPDQGATFTVTLPIHHRGGSA